MKIFDKEKTLKDLSKTLKRFEPEVNGNRVENTFWDWVSWIILGAIGIGSLVALCLTIRF